MTEIATWCLTMTLMIIGLIGVILPILPGTTLILIAALIHKWILPADLTGVTIGFIALFWFLSVLADLGGVLLGTRWFGGSKWGMAGASGGATSTGSALQSTGPSASYGAKVSARVRPNIVFPDNVQGNPSADVEVRSAPDGTITGRRLVKSSGNKAWDDAVLRAIDKTETLPRDTDGRVPSLLLISFRPKE